MDGERLLLAAVLVGAGVALAVIGRKQRAATLHRNSVAGLRTSETLRSDEAWQAAHAATAGSITAGGVGLLLAGAVVAVPAISERTAMAVLLGATGATLALVLAAGVRGHRIAARVNREASAGEGPGR
jgi:uncharacterized membrane protein